MPDDVENRLKAAGITLPQPVAPVANYVPFVISGPLVFISGQLPMENGALAYTGKVGREVSPEDGKEAARLCAINLIAQLKAACGGDLGRVVRLVKLGAFIASADDFSGQAGVTNGASDLMVEIFGDAGRHARSGVGTNVLPLDASVEIDAVFEIR
jgi:enamine deaminase RidA (YjgF/YER057c/UK114 family)